MSDKFKEPAFKNRYDWGLYPQTEKFLYDQITFFLKHHGFASKLSTRMEKETSTRIFDWIDHIVLPEKKVQQNSLDQLGFKDVEGINHQPGDRVFIHPESIFFPVILSSKEATEIVLKPERLDHFILMTGTNTTIEGDILAPYRKAIISPQGDYILSAVERRGYNGFIVPENVKDTDAYMRALEAFYCRQRVFDNEMDGIKATLDLIKGFFNSLTKERVADAFFRVERFYWERRTMAGQIQKARQDRLGLGWGNHDHYTYRSSRENFVQLIQVFEILGFMCCEQFFAGEMAGWGAQVLEHPICNIVLFTDVDISKDERDQDFAHREITSKDRLKTVGLWVALHGESILGAGLHHLATRVDFERTRNDFKSTGADTLHPFSYFEFLKQAFSAVEKRAIDKERLDGLLNKNQITRQQHKTFLQGGAISSHLEIIQRDQGFKGFNQDSVTVIIKTTDPRKQREIGA